LLLSALSLATAEGVDEALLAEWERSQPELQARSLRAAQQAATKGWRWTGEMEEVAKTYQSAGLPEGFHRAAAELFERASRDEEARPDETTLKKVLEAFLNRPHD
jgi:transcriptional regulator with XRE-family HTH domain